MTNYKFIDPRRLYFILSIIVIAIPCLVLFGWQFNIESFKSVLPQLISMNPLTAVLFIFCGLSLFFIRESSTRKYKRIGKTLGLIIILIAILKLSNFIPHLDIRIDQILYSNDLKGNKMAPSTVICFLLVGISLFTVDDKWNNKYNLSQIFSLIALTISLLAVIGYIYASRSFYQFTLYIPIALHTAFTFCALTTAIIISRYKTGFVSVIMNKNVGGIIIRRLLPFCIAIPIVVSWLRLEGGKLKLYDAEFGSSLGVIFIISTFVILMWFIAGSLNRTDEERKDSEAELYKAKEDLAAKEVLYRNLIENSGVVMYTASLDGKITFTSNKGYHLTGYTVGELLGKKFTGLVSQDCLEMVKDLYRAQLKDNVQETTLEFSITRKDGGERLVEQSTVLINENNVPVGFQCVVKDITEKRTMESVVRKYEKELIKNQELLQSILDNATSLIYIKDLHGKYLLINKQFRNTLNVSNDVIGKTDFDFTDNKQAQRFKDSDEEVIRTCRSVELEEVLEMPDGKHTVLIIKFPLVDAQNKIYGISGIATDISERVKYQQQLIEAREVAEGAKKLQEQFLANMSHEIRTPMNGIQGMIDLLLETPLNNEQKDFAKTIKRSSDNLLVIINDILDFSKIQAGKLTVEKIDFDLREVIDNVKAILNHRLNEKNLALKIHIDQDVPTLINGDPFRLNQILINLVGNAIKFTHHGGIDIKVVIESKEDKDVVLNFSVSDTGIGIPSDKLSEVFESFTQATVGTSRMYGGTGLGLAITKQLLEMQNGKISVESTINEGTTFKISIPYIICDSNVPTAFAGAGLDTYRTLLKGKKFLVAEDNEINQKVVTHVLQKAGGIVDIANNGVEAISFLKNNNDYNLIIMDLQMPVMDGYATTKYIRNVLKLSTPIVAMTASALRGERSKCIEIGMNEYLTKPFDFATFYKTISSFLGDCHDMPAIPVKAIESEEKLFDLSLLEEMDDHHYTADILTIFLNDSVKELNHLRSACMFDNFQKAYMCAHKMKSSAGLLKVKNMLDNLVKIEEVCKSEQPNLLALLYEQVNDAYMKVEIPLQDHLRYITADLDIAV